MTMESKLSFREMNRSDIKAVCELMSSTKGSVGGVGTSHALEAVCREAMLNENFVIVVARADKRLVGYVFAVVNPRLAWPHFLMKNSSVAWQILQKKILRWGAKKKSSRPQESAVVGTDDAVSVENLLPLTLLRRSWADSSPQIAKIVHVGVKKSMRCRGIASGLYVSLFEYLRLRGVRRIDAQVAVTNLPSVRLHRKVFDSLSWLDRRTVFATKDL